MNDGAAEMAALSNFEVLGEFSTDRKFLMIQILQVFYLGGCKI